MKPQLKVLTAYTGTEDLKSALKHPQSVKMLWLEILFNDSFNWESNLQNPIVRAAYRKASVWYHHFQTLIDRETHRKPLKKFEGNWDEREYRRFLEVLNFVSR
ncbi:MAG: hypothetical protein A3A86_07310 [Elusimicrobia bacterium RIFCSPLOWO2_01_FULL_60_11]|nr:MAG: hypothetical protein A3A86_07310 [Elusimicrobia bacterium RIFCSPLOWO2_01_FULL_60_11]